MGQSSLPFFLSLPDEVKKTFSSQLTLDLHFFVVFTQLKCNQSPRRGTGKRQKSDEEKVIFNTFLVFNVIWDLESFSLWLNLPGVLFILLLDGRWSCGTREKSSAYLSNNYGFEALKFHLHFFDLEVMFASPHPYLTIIICSTAASFSFSRVEKIFILSERSLIFMI